MKRNLFPRFDVLAYLAIHGPTSSDNLHKAMGSSLQMPSFYNALTALQAQGRVRNLQPLVMGRSSLWEVVPKESIEPARPARPSRPAPLAGLHPGMLQAQVPEPSTPVPEPHVYPRYCLEQVAPAPRYDTRASGPWCPPTMACARPGAQDFLRVPSLCAGERRAHQPGYVAVLATGKNHPAPGA